MTTTQLEEFSAHVANNECTFSDSASASNSGNQQINEQERSNNQCREQIEETEKIIANTSNNSMGHKLPEKQAQVLQWLQFALGY